MEIRQDSRVFGPTTGLRPVPPQGRDHRHPPPGRGLSRVTYSLPPGTRRAANPAGRRPERGCEMPLAKVVEDGLREYAIGEKLRALRHQKKMGLVALARHSGFSAGLLSKIERGRVFPPLGTLLRIAMVFGVGLDYFFVDERRHHVVSVVRKAERKRFPDDPDARRASYRFESLDFPATERASSAYLAEFEPGKPGRVRRHQHAG